MSDTVEKYAPKLPSAVRRQVVAAEKVQVEAAKANDPLYQAPPENQTQAEQEAQHRAQADMFPSERAAAAPAPQQGEDWEAKFRTLQGKYDSEVVIARNNNRSLQSQVQQMTNQIQSLQSIIATVNSRPAAGPATTVVQPDPSLESDTTEYGELVQKSRAWARAEIEPEMAAMRQQIERLSGQTQHITQQTSKQRIEAALDAWSAETGLNWQQQNNDPAFIDWLQQNDAFSGRKIGDMLGEAYRAGEGHRVAAIFGKFAAETSAISGQQPTQGRAPNPPAPAAASGKVPLETLAAPGKGTPGRPAAAPHQRIWTPADVKTFYDRRTRGFYKGREGEALALEEDLIRAAAEGRYRA